MEQKSKKNSNDKSSRNRLFLFIIISIIIICIIIGIVVLNNNAKNNSENNNSNNNQANSNGNNSYVDGSTGIIDMNNTKNATISNGIKKNTSNKLSQEKTFEGMKITNILLQAENGVSTLTANVENTSGKDFSSKSIVMKFTNEDGSSYAELEGIISDVKAGETTMIDAGTTADIINAYDFTIEILK